MNFFLTFSCIHFHYLPYLSSQEPSIILTTRTQTFESKLKRIQIFVSTNLRDQSTGDDYKCIVGVPWTLFKILLLSTSLQNWKRNWFCTRLSIRTAFIVLSLNGQLKSLSIYKSYIQHFPN